MNGKAIGLAFIIATDLFLAVSIAAAYLMLPEWSAWARGSVAAIIGLALTAIVASGTVLAASSHYAKKPTITAAER